MNPLQIEIDFSKGRENAISKQMNVVNSNVRHNDCDIVLSLIDGIKCTQEIADLMGKPINKISGRFSQLKANKAIKVKGTKSIHNSKFTIYEIIN